MGLEPSLFFVVPYPLGTTAATFAVTATTFATVAGAGGVQLPSADLLAVAGKGRHTGVLVQLLAWLQTPSVTAGATAEARLVIERDDFTVQALPGSGIRVSVAPVTPAAPSPMTRLRGPLVDITSFLADRPAMSLRLQARTTTGTALLVAPTLAFYRDNRP